MHDTDKESEKINITLLHVEPQEALREDFKRLVTEEIKTFYQTDSLLNARELFRNQRPDVVVLSVDLLLCEAGKDFLNDLNLFFIKKHQIILTLPKDKGEHIPEFNESGFYNFIFTPFKKEQLIPVIKNCVELIELKEDFNKINKIMLDLVKELNECKNDREKIIFERDEYKNIIDQAPFGVMLLDIDYKIKYLNQTFTKIFGYEKDDLPNGKTWLSLAYPDPIYKHEVISNWLKEAEKDFLERREPWIFTVSCKDNTTKRINFKPVKLETGGILIFSEDLEEYEKYKNKFFFSPNIDTLTGLPNRHSLEASLRQLIERAKSSNKRGSRSTMIFANIDDFQEINQNYGHIAGDEVLITVAKLFKNSLRTGDTVFRFEGDEFVVLLRGTSMAEARLAAERLQKTINQHIFVLDYTKYTLNITMGIIQIDGSMDTTALLSNAVQTVQKSKKEGKNLISIYQKDEHSIGQVSS